MVVLFMFLSERGVFDAQVGDVVVEPYDVLVQSDYVCLAWELAVDWKERGIHTS